MKSASTALQNFLLAVPSPNQNFFVADLFTFTLLDSTVIRLDSLGVDIPFGGQTFSGTGVQIKRSDISNTIGLQVSSIDIDIIANASDQLHSQPLLAQIAAGAFDGATVRVERVFMPTLGDVSMGSVVLFAGTVSDISEIGRTHARITVKSLIELLNIQLPRNLYSPGCRHTLYDAGCTLAASAFTFNGTVGSGSTTITIPSDLTKPGPLAAPSSAPTLSAVTNTSGVNLSIRSYFVVVTYYGAAGESSYSVEASIALNSNQTLHVASPSSASGANGWNVYVGFSPGDEQRQNGSGIAIATAFDEPATGIKQGVPPPAIATGGYFAQGTVKFTSGINNGLVRVVRQYFGNGTLVIYALPQAPAPGDTFTATAGCDKALNTCDSKFANHVHFGGAPWIPTPEAAA